MTAESRLIDGAPAKNVAPTSLCQRSFIDERLQGTALKPSGRTSLPRRAFKILGGICTALAVCEFLLRSVMTPYGGRIYTWGVERRQFTEGFAISTFSADGRRLTGNGDLKGAPYVLLLGDSHVEGLQVSDQVAMGSVLERTLRSSTGPVNVAAYGFGNAAAPKFCSMAEELLARWHPQRVIVFLDRRSLGSAVLSGPLRFVPTADGRLALARSAEPRKSFLISFLSAVVKRSSLAYLAWGRWKQMPSFLPVLPSAKAAIPKQEYLSSPATASLSVKGLQQSYGSRLLIAYDPMDDGTEDSRALEREFLKACRDSRADCVDLAGPLSEEVMPRGFPNTMPNTGHYNAAGHHRVAEALATALKENTRSSN